jgi:hypothetical protein
MHSRPHALFDHAMRGVWFMGEAQGLTSFVPANQQGTREQQQSRHCECAESALHQHSKLGGV